VNSKLAKVTIVSTLPFILTERKPGQVPGYYEIARAEDKESVGITHLGDSWFPEFIPMTESKVPPRKTEIPAERVAEGLVSDYIGASLEVSFDPLENGAIRAPGIFWLNGIKEAPTVLALEKAKVAQARKNTIAWFWALTKAADDTWVKFHQHVMITDIQRIAAKYLNLEREWNVDVFAQMLSTATCPSCKTNVVTGAWICGKCNYILDMDMYKKNKERYAVD
jgi:ribosomal protein L37AE/L43A